MEQINVRCKARNTSNTGWAEGFPIFTDGKLMLVSETSTSEVIPTTACRITPWEINGVNLYEHDTIINSLGYAVVKYGEYNLVDLLDTECIIPDNIETIGFYLEYENGERTLIDYDSISRAEIIGNEFDEDNEIELSAREAIHILVYNLKLTDGDLIDARKKAIKALTILEDIEKPAVISVEEIRNYTGKPVYILYGDEGEWDIITDIVDNTVSLMRHSVTLDTYGEKWLAYAHEPNSSEDD